MSETVKQEGDFKIKKKKGRPKKLAPNKETIKIDLSNNISNFMGKNFF